ncbi:MAG: hemolysin family protein [Lachnospiraceae bacterium]|jgi:CBS domain containing-hemolysin-like protein
MSDDDPGDRKENFFSGLFHRKKAEKITEEEILDLVSEGQESGALKDSEAEMIGNVLNFSDTQVHEIMTHTAEIDSFSCTMTVEDALKKAVLDRYSRHPVINGDIDNIIGIMHLKDLAYGYLKPEIRGRALSELGDDLLIPPYFVPETQNISKLFRSMQHRKLHMAVVIDEYGQTAGIVTMEDILEELVGDIEDEHDEDNNDIIPETDGTWILSGQASLDDVEDKLGMHFDVPEDITTINGFMTDRMGHIPEEGDSFETDCDGWNFRVLTVKNRVIQRVKAKKSKQE